VGVLLVGLLFPTSFAGVQSRIGGGTLCLATEFPVTDEDPSWRAWGKSLEDAVRLAVLQNQSLGNGYMLAMIPYSETPKKTIQKDPRQGAHNVSEMVNTPCIVGMIGPGSSHTALVEMPITAKAGVAMISPANTMPALTMRIYAGMYGVDFDQLHPPGKKINYFRTIANDAFQGVELATFSGHPPPAGLGARSAFVVDGHTPYGEVLIGSFTQQFLAQGGAIVGTDSIPFGGAARVAELAARIVASRPEVVVYGGATEDGGALLKAQLVQAGYRGLFVGGDGIAKDSAFVEQVGVTGSNDVFAIDPIPDPTQIVSNAATRFVRDFHARYPGEDLDGYGAYAYDAAMALIAAIKRLIQQGQVVTRETVLEQVQSVQIEGVTGQIAFDPNGDCAHGTFSVYTVQNGRWVWVKHSSV
jgi:branched-chain amino acid transport system substrate-binding protein